MGVGVGTTMTAPPRLAGLGLAAEVGNETGVIGVLVRAGGRGEAGSSSELATVVVAAPRGVPVPTGSQARAPTNRKAAVTARNFMVRVRRQSPINSKYKLPLRCLESLEGP